MDFLSPFRRGSAGTWLLSAWVCACAGSRGFAGAANEGIPFEKKTNWPETIQAARSTWRELSPPAAERPRLAATWWAALQDDFPVECDWALQDAGLDVVSWLSDETAPTWDRRLVTRALGSQTNHNTWQRTFQSLNTSPPHPEDLRWLEFYVDVARQRRATRLSALRTQAPRIVFTKRRTMRPSFFAYTEGQSDAQHERHFEPGAQLCLFEWENDSGKVRTLLSEPKGVLRDPAVSWDGQRVAFAWKKSLDDDDYHLYELDVSAGTTRQITSGLGFADYEPAYLPNGNLIFASTRCVQTVDCWWTEVSNLYTCDPQGQHWRRLGFDQVHTVYPQVLDDGRVIYTRWDYNDRGQVFPQPLFQMQPDGTGQAEFYGNSSWFPTTIAHARGIPGTGKVMAILCGHHTTQAGKLAIIDPSRGRQENQGVQLVAPVRPALPERIDAYGQSGDLWQYPYPLNERECLVTYAPRGWSPPNRRSQDADFGIYWMDLDGQRELLVRDPDVASQQPVPLVARPVPALRSSQVKERQREGTYYVQDANSGPALAGVPRGTIKRLRVVALAFRPAGIGNNGSAGPGGEALICTPIAIGNGSWDVKIVLGETPVQADGSVFFKVPARTPVYFQALDEHGHAVQTMRSWSTLQPGETQTCVGCHDEKNTAPPVLAGGTLALRAAPRDLEPFYGPARGFSFAREIQPILDRHCVRCHDQPERKPDRARITHFLAGESDPAWPAQARPAVFPGREASPQPEALAAAKPAFSLRRNPVEDAMAKRKWSEAYLNLTLAEPAHHEWDRGSFGGLPDGSMVNWIGSQSIPAPLPPYAAGAARSGLFPLLAKGHYGVQLTKEELDKIACWIDLLVPFCGDYQEANAWTAEEKAKYDHFSRKRRQMEDWVQAQQVPAP